MTNAERFLNAFIKIERHLRKLTNEDRGTRFSTLVSSASRSHPAVKRYETDLKEFADLRNAIVHERTDGRPIAEPYDQTVEELERIVTLLLKPPALIPPFQSKVVALTTSDPVSRAVEIMLKNSFSQVPIYEDKEFIALLNTNTIARWLGASIAQDIFSLSETMITDVLGFMENEDNCLFFGRNNDIFDVLECFQQWEQQGKRLEAILITADGKRNQSLLGIITVHDLAKIMRMT
jgi:predicted transcriptional regulator